MGLCVQDPEEMRKKCLGKKELCCNDKEAAPAQRETVTQNVQGKGKEAGKSSSEIMDFLSRK